MNNQSEIARIRERVDLEVAALQQLKCGFAKCADHATIQHHYKLLDGCFHDLAACVGEEEALNLLCERTNTIQ